MNHSVQSEYIFTPTGFLIENAEDDANEEVQDCYHLLYKMGTSTQPDNLTMSGYFLFQVAVTFFKKLMAIPDRVFLHLVENKDADYPFAFLATYATKTTEDISKLFGVA